MATINTLSSARVVFEKGGGGDEMDGGPGGIFVVLEILLRFF